MKTFFKVTQNIVFGLILLGLSSGILLKTAGAADGSVPRKEGVQLWSENCARCHNMRSPAQYSDKQWDVIVHHMRVRANLTAQEAKQIAEFLKSSN